MMQEPGVDGVDVALQRLQPIRLELGCRYILNDVCGCHVGFEIGKWGRCGTRSHVRPDDAAALLTRVRSCLDLVSEIALGRLVGHVDARAVHIEFPAVVHTPQAGFLVATEEQRRATMWTV